MPGTDTGGWIGVSQEIIGILLDLFSFLIEREAR